MGKRLYHSTLLLLLVSFFLFSLLLITQSCTKLGTSIHVNLDKASDNSRFIDNGDGTITDTNTGLMWTKKDSYADLGECLDWDNSKSYVSRLTTGEHADWRMPTVQELKTIFDKSRLNKDFSGDTIHSDPIFASGGAWRYWSSEIVASCCSRDVDFGLGSIGEDRRNGCFSYGVRAVRR